MGSDRSCWFWAYFFTIFLAFKKGEGVSAVLLAIFLRKKGSDSPFFIILFTESYCRERTASVVRIRGARLKSAIVLYPRTPSGTLAFPTSDRATRGYSRETDKKFKKTEVEAMFKLFVGSLGASGAGRGAKRTRLRQNRPKMT